MCGLVGIYSSNMLNKHKECLSALLYLDTWRGKDSTGVAAIRQNADTSTLKSTVPGYDFIEGPRLDQHLRLNDFCWIGHNRFGTVGRNIKSNAHPFEVLDDDGSCIIVGAHNGTLKNRHVLENYQQFGTDSEALFNQIARKGLKDTLAIVEGAWALTYYDHEEEELRVIRNKERPLFYGYEEGKKTLIWASEMWMIRVACSKAGIKLEEDKVFSFAEDTLYRFPAPMKINEVLTCEREGGLVGKTSTFFQGGTRTDWTGGVHGYIRHNSGTTTQPETAQKTSQSNQAGTLNRQSAIIQNTNIASGTPTENNGEKQALSNVNSSSDPLKGKDNKATIRNILDAKSYKGYANVRLSKRQLEDMLMNGCAWCESEFINIGDKFGWLAPGKPVCAKCLEDGHDDDEELKSSSSVSVH